MSAAAARVDARRAARLGTRHRCAQMESGSGVCAADGRAAMVTRRTAVYVLLQRRPGEGHLLARLCAAAGAGPRCAGQRTGLVKRVTLLPQRYSVEQCV